MELIKIDLVIRFYLSLEVLLKLKLLRGQQMKQKPLKGPQNLKKILTGPHFKNLVLENDLILLYNFFSSLKTIFST